MAKKHGQLERLKRRRVIARLIGLEDAELRACIDQLADDLSLVRTLQTQGVPHTALANMALIERALPKLRLLLASTPNCETR